MPLEKKQFFVNAAEYSWKNAAVHLNKACPNMKFVALASFEGKSLMVSALDVTPQARIMREEVEGEGKIMHEFYHPNLSNKLNKVHECKKEELTCGILCESSLK